MSGNNEKKNQFFLTWTEIACLILPGDSGVAAGSVV